MMRWAVGLLMAAGFVGGSSSAHAADVARRTDGHGSASVRTLPRPWARDLSRSALPVPGRFLVVRGVRLYGSADTEETLAVSFPGRIVTHGPMDAAARMHEVGHQFNFEDMTVADEDTFAVQVLGERPGADWWFDTNFLGVPLAEEFAEIYSVLARHPHCYSDELPCFDNEGYLLRDLTRTQVRRARVLIRQFAQGWHAADASGYA